MEARSDESWRVDSYQVPVPLGDCSLHFSVVSKAGKLEIDTAIIVDDGSGKDANGRSAKDAIEATVGEVTTKYKYEEFPGFHYWLVTHWDDDHYDGALYYLLERKQKQKHEKQIEVYGPVRWDDESLGVRSEKDRENIKSLFGKEKCHTYVIGQDFFGGGEAFKRPQNMTFFEWSRSLVPKPTQDLTHDKSDKEAHNKSHREAHDIADGKKPMFLCVGSARDCFNSNKHRRMDEKIEESGEKNATSAFFIIAWPGSENICYYAAGDGNKEIEKYFQETEFLDAGTDNGALVLKGTHHGAFNAFNAELFRQMKPRNYVVSAGNQFGHPTAALLVLFAIHKLVQPEGDKFTLYTSRYPYWLIGNPNEHNKTFLNAERIQEVFDMYETKDEMFTNIKESIQTLDNVKFDTLVKGLRSVWKFLTGSDPPSVPENETKSYRVHMRFKRAAMDKSEVKISVYASEEGDAWNKE